MFITALHNRLLMTIFATFCFFLIGTLVAWKITTDIVVQEAHTQLYQKSSQIKGWIRERLRIYILTAEGLRNTVETEGNSPCDDWPHFVRRLGLFENYPGVSSLSFSQRVDTPEKTSFIIKCIEPLAGRQRAIGFDLTSDENRRQAVERARDTALPSATGKIILPTTSGPGFAFFLPVYKNNIGPESSLEDRKKSIWGIISISFRGMELFKTIYDQPNLFPNLDLEIYQSDNLTPENLLYDHDPQFPAISDQANRHLTTKETIDVGGQIWIIVVTTKNGWGLTPSQEILPKVVLFGGLFTSFLFLIFFLYQYYLHLQSH